MLKSKIKQEGLVINEPLMLLHSHILFLNTLPDKRGSLISIPGSNNLKTVDRSDIIQLFSRWSNVAVYQHFFKQDFLLLEQGNLDRELNALNKLLFSLAGRPLSDNLTVSKLYSAVTSGNCMSENLFSKIETHLKTINF